MTKKYLLVTDAVPEQVEAATGLQGHWTPLGTLVEEPAPFDMEAALDRLDRALRPTSPRCTCGKHAVVHSPRCPLAFLTT